MNVTNLLHEVNAQLTIAERLFSTLNVYAESENEVDREQSKKLAANTREFLFDYYGFSADIDKLEAETNHPTITALKDLEILASFLVTLSVSIEALGSYESAGAPSMAIHLIQKARANLSLH